MAQYTIVWNNDKTEGFITSDAQVAYEARKGADDNCFSCEGEMSELAVRFCEIYSHREDCTSQMIEISEYI